MNDPKHNKIVDRIRKLLALSSSNNEHEAATAAAAAARLMAQHGIADVELESDPDPVGDNRDLHVEIGKGKRPTTWKWNLAWGVAESGQCKPYTLHLKSPEGKILSIMVAFIGRRSDASACAYLYQYLLAELRRLHDEKRPRAGQRLQIYVPGAAPPVVDSDYRRRWSRDFYLGAVSMLLHRMREARDEVIQTAQTTALVRLNTVADEVDAAAEDLGLRYVKAREFDVFSDRGFAEGVEAARELDLRNPDHEAHEALPSPNYGPEKP